ncbi:uncharacterized protein ALTATR162_LOCUS5054 [Alternaria atra]|uniref:Zn(2)-C6 fungal-type domain-containing protein n=1 Tax=Alternaria atra TaxID=119953 RepID=A0A8J2I2A4_9PLEO|nr:uncharacterized protein ALTATR162_LOCUS5054 [Alternaria atra]CAG5158242.1 unnamed protein product [Alternaria atra]
MSLTPANRMRLGTRSCAECRRRKVRCVFLPHRKGCESCATHGTPCRTQQPKRRPAVSLQRSEELGGAFRQLPDIAQLGRSSFPDSHSSPSYLSTASSDGAQLHAALDPSDEGIGHLESVPLINLFRDARLIQSIDGSPHKSVPTAGLDVRVQDATRLLMDSVPSQPTLRLILSETNRYWLTWPLCYYGSDTSDFLQPDRVNIAQDFISSALTSLNPSLVAKALLFLCLCIQQLAKQCRARSLLPDRVHSLVESYISIASTLLSIDSEHGGSIDALESRMFLLKICVTTGKPRKAWTTGRSALEAALLLGLHRIDQQSTDRKKKLWRLIWQSDRHLSLLLGLPCAISNTHPGVRNKLGGESIIEQILYECSFLAGAVAERDQEFGMADYAVTVELDRRLQQLQYLFPPSWFHSTTDQEISVDMHYYIQIAMLQYFLLSKHIHLPYMLKSTAEPRFLPSRISTMAASRSIIQAYHQLRDDHRTKSIICELMDFEAFSAAVTLIIGIFSESKGGLRNYAQAAGDWAIVRTCVQTLRRTEQLLECSIARQGAQLLEYLSMAWEGNGDAPERFESIIPFFGKIKINRAAVARTQEWESGRMYPMDDVSMNPPTNARDSSLCYHDSGSQLLWENTIEFSANPSCFDYGADLGGNWQDPVCFGAAYEWTQSFSHVETTDTVAGDMRDWTSTSAP